MGKINISEFNKEYRIQYEAVDEMLIKFGINTGNWSGLTETNLKSAFNKLIRIPNLAKLLEENIGLSYIQSGEATDAIMRANYAKLAEIYPHSLEMSLGRYY